MTLAEALRSRIDPKWRERSDPAVAIADMALNWIGVAQRKKRELASPGTLSPKGVAQQLRAHLSGGIGAELRRYQEQVKARAESLKAQREALLSPTFDKADLLGELRRQELRTWLRGMEPTQRFITLLEDKEGVLMEAALGAPAALSGLQHLRDHQRDQLLASYLENKHGPLTAAIAEAEEANNLARVACEAAIGDMRDEVELNPQQFEAWFSTGAEPEKQAA